ncbi:MAG: hypothetical protein ABS81_21880 [Pseudonocardia sp. SCN 72-86]|nr:MAG: hypothetical protein ABS81_21880 [Pseudonocardia sp. SCN 72-86]
MVAARGLIRAAGQSGVLPLVHASFNTSANKVVAPLFPALLRVATGAGRVRAGGGRNAWPAELPGSERDVNG